MSSTSDVCCPSCNHVLLHMRNGQGAVNNSAPSHVVKGEAQAVCPHCGGTLTVQLVIGPEGEGSYRTVPTKS